MNEETEKPLIKLLRLAGSANICDELEDNQLTKIGRDVVKWTGLDDGSRDDWKKKAKDAMDLALQVVEEKSFPWQGASNVKYPLISVAALQFHARAYPAIVNGNKIVKGLVNGEDQDGGKLAQAKRVAGYMNWQLLEEMPEWDEQMDKLLLALPIEGCEFKKSYFDPGTGRNVSEWVRPEDFIVDYKTKSLSTCPRMTHRLWFYPQEITEKQRMEIWRDVDLNISVTETEEEELQEFYEQHTLLDLDEDGYKEPYCVTVHVKSANVVRVKSAFYPEDIWVQHEGQPVQVKKLLEADQYPQGDETISKIERIQYFSKYSFIPAPDGGFYDIGFGQLIVPLSTAVDTTINQMLDAGTLANLSGGFVRSGVSVQQRRGKIQFEMGEFKEIKVPGNTPISEALYQMRFDGPSPVLFQLLGMLIQGTKDITGVQDIMVGGQQQNETATTTMARVEQSLKVFSAIFKRVYRGLGEELQKLYKLNGIYLQPQAYYRVLDDDSPGVVSLEDFKNDGADIRPVADPTLGTTMQKMARAELLMGLKGDPTINVEEVNKRFLDAAEVENPESLIVPADQRPQPPADTSGLELELKTLRLQDEAHEIHAKTAAAYAKALESMASAESKEVGMQLNQYKAQLETLRTEMDVINQGRNQGMAEGQGNTGDIKTAGGPAEPGMEGYISQPGLEQAGLDAGIMPPGESQG